MQPFVLWLGYKVQLSIYMTWIPQRQSHSIPWRVHKVVALSPTVPLTWSSPYLSQVQVDPLDQGPVYTKRIDLSGVFSLPDVWNIITGFSLYTASDFVLPELEIVGCTVTYKPNLNEYEVNFQWRAPFSPAGFSFVRHFRITVFQMMRGNLIPLVTFSPEIELVNVSYSSGRTESCSMIQHTISHLDQLRPSTQPQENTTSLWGQG